MTCRETEGSTGEQCRRENSSYRACSHAEGCSGQAYGNTLKIPRSIVLFCRIPRRAASPFPQTLGSIRERTPTARPLHSSGLKGEMLRCSGEMKKLLIGRANCAQNKSQWENPKQIVGNRQ